MSSVMPVFIPGQAGRLFAIYHHPATGEKAKKAILHIPAFAEEMNKSRRMIAMQAREFAKSGYAVLIFDLFGTGDSEGKFSDATWEIWKNDVHTVCQWLIEQGILNISLWSLRSGILLAMDFLEDAKIKFDRMLCWQPVLNGEIFIMQFLRLRVAAALMDKSAHPEKASDLKQQLLDGKVVEVAGYTLHPDLINPLMKLFSDNIHFSKIDNINVFELISSCEKGISPGINKLIESLQQRAHLVSVHVVVGSSFWSTQEIAEVPELITQTVNSLY
ncbi:Hydrolase, exosortase system type 1 associated [Candidatus Methylobacter favarea]|uniref:Hydrolase, exosortase system type 1 associated n=1 Tax=Candidatus Methylobacter favarea TaxID=2707345 RepID=A0A8S0WXW3_9GAMM|nr:hydrolase 2, exosortase A system-associated [Candidatus Methylobacter favarea]CAA9889313.1 Hydrolase, exosortase system type 1 associated [Candidatus Methylobacter favarea]